MAVAGRQHAGRLVGRNRGLHKDRAAAVMHQITDTSGIGHVIDMKRIGESASLRHPDKIDSGRGMARLHAGLAVMPVVQHDDGEILRLLDPDGGKAAEPHQGFAVAGQHRDPARGLRERQAEADHGGAAHRPPEIEIERMIAAGGGIVSRRTEPGDDEQIAPLGQHLFHECAAIERRPIHHRLVHHLVHCLRPISRCDRMMATGRSPLNAMSHPAATTSSTSSGASTR